MKKNPLAKVYLILVCFVGIVLAGLCSISLVIFTSINTACNDAKTFYGGDCVSSLSLLVADPTKSFRQRNTAVWALGQLQDKRALPVLQQYYTGRIPSREPLDATLSQYELQKAIRLINGDTKRAPIFSWIIL